jgi:WhiB family transcriptional regulator, redox-sensing transcriptional regulator
VAEGTPWENLLVAILRGTPKLPNALCRNRPAEFDAADDEQATEAAALCRRCPDRQPCRVWADGLPDSAVSGVVAGELREWVSHPSLRRPRRPPGRPRKAVV